MKKESSCSFLIWPIAGLEVMLMPLKYLKRLYQHVHLHLYLNFSATWGWWKLEVGIFAPRSRMLPQFLRRVLTLRVLRDTKRNSLIVIPKSTLKCNFQNDIQSTKILRYNYLKLLTIKLFFSFLSSDSVDNLF